MRSRRIGVRLFGPFALLAGVMACALIVSAIAGAREIDANRQAREEVLVANGLTGRVQELEASVTPQIMWDDAVAKLDNDFDLAWAESNIGAFLHQNNGFDVSIVLSGEGAPIYSHERGAAPKPDALAAYLQAAAPLVARVREAEVARGPFKPQPLSKTLVASPIQSSATVLTPRGLFIFTASLVQPDFGGALPKGPRAPVLVTGEMIDAPFVDRLAERFLLKHAGLELGVAAPVAGRAQLPLKDESGRALASIWWTPETPGSDLLSNALAPIGLVVALLGIGCLVLFLRGGRAARALIESETRLGMALSVAGAGAFEIDFRARTFWASPELNALIGRELVFNDVEAWPWSVVHADDRALAAREAKAAGPGPYEARILMPDGGAAWRRVYFEAIRGADGRALHAIGLVLDIDERKRQELALIEAQQAAQAGAEAKSRFLASVSHEIRTPMNGVVGVLHLLKAEKLTRAGRQLLTEALACGQMLASLVDDVLDFSRIEADRLELAPEPTDPAEVLGGVARLLRTQAEAKGVALTCAVGEGVGPVMVDPIRLRQCLFNLIGNAVKFTAKGSVSVTVARPDGEEGPRLRFEIADTGIGISPEAQLALFQRFQQADSSTTRRFGGTGLGLAITKRLAEMMGGAVGLSSREGEGSVFWLEIAAPDASLAEPDSDDGTSGLEGLRVLVVEDNATNRLIATKILEGLGASVRCAPDGEAGVAAAREGYDLILMDIQMPGIDGLEATRQIRASRGPEAQTPIIALTANVLNDQRDTYRAAGMNGCVSKPIAPAALVAEIARVASEPSVLEALAG